MICPFRLNTDTWSEAKCIAIDDNPMIYCPSSDESAIFPGLRKIARNIFITPGSSAPSESMFSDSGHTVGKKRTRLLDAKVDYLTFLGSWMKHKMKKNKK